MVGPGEFKGEDGALVTHGGMGLLWFSREKFGDCQIRVRFKLSSPKDNSGIFIRIPEPPPDPWFAVHRGYEIQIFNESDDYHRTGCLYSFTRALARSDARTGEWNSIIVTLDGPRTIVEVNGVRVTNYLEGDPVPPKSIWYEPERGPRPNSRNSSLRVSFPNSTRPAQARCRWIIFQHCSYVNSNRWIAASFAASAKWILTSGGIVVFHVKWHIESCRDGGFSGGDKITRRETQDERKRQAEVVGGGEAADRVGRDEPERDGVGLVPSRGDQSESILSVEEATVDLGVEDIRCEGGSCERGGGEEVGGIATVEGRGGGDHDGEPGAKKRALGLEDYGQLPPELQKRVHEQVERTKERSGWPAVRTLQGLGISRRSYYRWLKEEAWARALPAEPVQPV